MEIRQYFAGVEGDVLLPERLIPSAKGLEHIVRLVQEEKPEAVLLGGDTLDWTHPAGERRLRDAVTEMGVPVLAVPGNHEEECTGVWDKGVQVYQTAGFRIAAVDDRKRTVSPQTLSVLKALCADGVPTVLVMHIPLKTDYNTPKVGAFDPYFFLCSETTDETGMEYLYFVESEPAIRLVLCGHVHDWLDSEIAPGKRQLVCSQSITGNMVCLTISQR